MLSDCPKCWETPCACGYEWRMRDLEYLQEMYELIGTIIKEKTSSDGEEMDSTGQAINRQQPVRRLT